MAHLQNRVVEHGRIAVAGVAVGLGLQLLAGIFQIGLLGGLPSYFVMGLLIGIASPGSTIVEPGIAAFVLAGLGYLFGHVVLSLFGVGFVLAAGYGVIGLLLGIAGGWVGEAL